MMNDYNNGYNYGGYYGAPQANPYNKPQQSKPQVRQYSFVNGIEGAKAYQLVPNQSILLMDSDHYMCYMKSSDPEGRCGVRYFQLVELTEDQAREFLQPISQLDPNSYVSREEYNALNRKFDELLKKFDKSTTRKDAKDNA